MDGGVTHHAVGYHHAAESSGRQRDQQHEDYSSAARTHAIVVSPNTAAAVGAITNSGREYHEQQRAREQHAPQSNFLRRCLSAGN